MTEPEIVHFPGGNVIATISGKPTEKDLERTMKLIDKQQEKLQPTTYINERTGKKYKRKYALTDEQHTEIMKAMNALLDLSDKYEVPMFAVVQTECDPIKRGTPSRISGVSNTISPRTSDGFDLIQAITNLVCHKGITQSEYEKLYSCVREIAKNRPDAFAATTDK